MENVNLCHKIHKILRRYCEKICRFCDLCVDIYKILRDFIHTPNFTKAFISAIVLYGIALFALLRGDIYYMDDWGSASRETSWSHFSRYLATFMLTILATFGKGSLDISPLPQLFGVVLVVLSAMILLYLIRKKFDFIGIVASLPLGLSPYFLENLSYKFESLTMSIALFLAVLPFLFQNQRRVFCAMSVICLILMFMSYQAANASYIILSLYFGIFMRTDLMGKAGFLARCTLNLIIASAIYKFAIAQPVSEYTIFYTSDKMLALNGAFLPSVWGNLTTYATTIFNDLKNTAFIYLIALNCVLFVINTLFYKERRIRAFLGAILFLMLGFCASYGLYMVLETPTLHPRVFYGFNALIAVIAIANFAESTSKIPPPQRYYAEIPSDSATFIHRKRDNYGVFPHLFCKYLCKRT